MLTLAAFNFAVAMILCVQQPALSQSIHPPCGGLGIASGGGDGRVLVNGVAVVSALSALSSAVDRLGARPAPLGPSLHQLCWIASTHTTQPCTVTSLPPGHAGATSGSNNSDGVARCACTTSVRASGSTLHFNSTRLSGAGGTESERCPIYFDGLDILCVLTALQTAADALGRTAPATTTRRPLVTPALAISPTMAPNTAPSTPAAGDETGCLPRRQTVPARPAFIGRRGDNMDLNSSASGAVIINRVDIVSSLQELRDEAITLSGILNIDIAVEIARLDLILSPGASTVDFASCPPTAAPHITAIGVPVDVAVAGNFAAPAWRGYASGSTISGHLEITDNGGKRSCNGNESARPDLSHGSDGPLLEDMLRPAFARLDSVGGRLQIRNNSALTRLSDSEFAELAFVGTSPAAEYGRSQRFFEVRANCRLSTLDGGFPKLRTVGGYFNIYHNDAMTTIGQGFAELRSTAGHLAVVGNDALQELDAAFPRIELVGTALYIRRNSALASMDGAFARLVGVGSGGGFGRDTFINIWSNPALLTLGSSFQSIEMLNGDLRVQENAALTTLGNSFASLATIEGNLRLVGNPRLVSSGRALANLTAVLGLVFISGNPVLAVLDSLRGLRCHGGFLDGDPATHCEGCPGWLVDLPIC